ncbi:glycerol-3-phosphate 1-O-acyltransferase PlsY [Desulfocurvibacter africanus]|uniref:Glycerol-3-phosphate acyltransferase n=1 Tax=Desulfocurvibacter africanus subsp. africanus str. Walvis Bay TaxID=690850 RepID=F3Z2E4_DESAF|nr:glycerol-3-phosphate 1-O-acyltransferase PlsY [Desulfocurvibacter africanus]EGJ50184.1 Glycerol-3-phosphate acyltransferase [Desulfocurvibacter africanus subsp. africanus str. Walvis Bay]
MFLSIGWILMSYLIGSVPFGLVMAKAVCGVDPRLEGSRNTGATNVSRLCGTRYGLVVLALDLLKGWAPAAGAMTFSDNWFFLSLVGLAAIIGHISSPFLSGKGGKGVATTIGVFLALTPSALIISVLCCVAAITISGYVSLGSLTLGAALPLFTLLTGKIGFLPVTLLVAVLIYWKHRENIRRLATGQENPWRKKKTQGQA